MNSVYALLLLRVLEYLTAQDSDQELLELYNTWKPRLERAARGARRMTDAA